MSLNLKQLLKINKNLAKYNPQFCFVFKSDNPSINGIKWNNMYLHFINNENKELYFSVGKSDKNGYDGAFILKYLDKNNDDDDDGSDDDDDNIFNLIDSDNGFETVIENTDNIEKILNALKNDKVYVYIELANLEKDSNKTTKIITNENIKQLVHKYIQDKSKLPNNLQNKQINKWDVSNVTNMMFLFSGYKEFNEPLNNWNVSNVTNMSGMFAFCREFNQLLNDWNVSNVTNMKGMFSYCEKFNQPLDWNVSNVTSMERMFADCSNFNQPLNWNVSNVTSMERMFSYCKKFNQPLNNWNVSVSNVTSMDSMFADCYNFNQPLNDWNVSNVTSMERMFADCKKFNQPLNNWNVSNVTSMDNMFADCSNFNQLLNWNVSNVTNMEGMFYRCENFNQPLDNWNVSNVTNMERMFQKCINFNQPLNHWNVSNVTNMVAMFHDCINFNQPLNDWRINRRTNISSMFLNCIISPENKPGVRRIVDTRRIVNVDAHQIHKESAKINFEKLNNFLKEKTNQTISSNINFANFIQKMLLEMINKESNTEKKTLQKRNLQKIMNERLTNLNYQEISLLIRENIFYVLHYVSQQPKLFQEMYIESFLKDCINAYDGNNGMTCAMGGLERITFSLVPACTTNPDNKDYQSIISIITANPNELIPEYIKDWYQLHKTGTSDAFSSKTTEEEKRENLKSYLLTKFPNENELIEKKIIEYADGLGYDEESFMYGGRKTRKTRKTRKRKTKKRKTIKRKTKKRKTIKRKTKKRKT